MRRVVVHYILPVFAVIGLIAGIYMVYLSHKKPPTPPIPFPPASSPYEHYVAGAGMIEASSENISIGTPITEIVEAVFVSSGDFVEVGQPLFKLDTRQLEKQYALSHAALLLAQAEYDRQLDLPRPEDIPPLEAVVKQAEANYLNRLRQFELYEQVKNPKAISQDEYNQREFTALAAKYSLEEAQARLDLLKAGAWVRDLEIYRTRLKEAKRQVEVVEMSLARSIIRAPIAGQILQQNVHPGELAPAVQTVSTSPLILMGSVNPLHVRVEIDEDDAWRVLQGAKGMAFVRGNSSISIPLKFVEVKPFMTPKAFLTGDNSERVDTRVLEVIYEFEKNDLPIFTGQILDVFLEARPNLKPW